MVGAGELDIRVPGGPTLQVPALGYRAIKGTLTPVVLDGRFLSGPDELVMATDTMGDLGVEIGDEIGLSGPRGRATMTVVGRAVKPIVGDSAVNDGVVVPLDVWELVGALELLAEIDGEAALLVDIADPVQIDTVAADLAGQGAFVDQPFRQAEVTVLEDVHPVPLLLVSFTGLLGALAAAHALITASRRRRHELAVLRVLGLRPRQCAGVVWWQALVLTATALAVAVPLGVIGDRLVWTAIADRLNVLAVAEVPTAHIVALGLVATAASLLFAALPGGVGRSRPTRVGSAQRMSREHLDTPSDRRVAPIEDSPISRSRETQMQSRTCTQNSERRTTDSQFRRAQIGASALRWRRSRPRCFA